jgi:hypothetical protein
MAESSDGVGSWPAFVAQVNKTFNLLRDVFGYALPGGVFLAIGLISKRFSLSDVDDLLSPYHPPTWVYFISAVGACYIIGDILAATAYLPISVLKWVVWEGSRFRCWVKNWNWLKKWTRTRAMLKWLDDNLKAWPKDWLEHNPTEVSADLLVIRSRREPMFSSLDRRETLTILAGSTSVALLGGRYVFFRAKWDAGTIFLWAGIIVLLQFATGISHLRRVQNAIRKADFSLNAEESQVPDANADKLAGAVIDAADKLMKATKKALTA